MWNTSNARVFSDQKYKLNLVLGYDYIKGATRVVKGCVSKDSTVLDVATKGSGSERSYTCICEKAEKL
jgi:hypothetical protein